MLAPVSLPSRPATSALRLADTTSPGVVRPQVARYASTALDELPHKQRIVELAVFNSPRSLPVRVTEKAAALVEHYMVSLGCAGVSPPDAAWEAGSLDEQRGAIRQELGPRQEHAMMRNLRLYCRGLASAVAEVIRHDPEHEGAARAVGERMVRHAAVQLTLGGHVQPPDFYQVARQTSARLEADRQRVAERRQGL